MQIEDMNYENLQVGTTFKLKHDLYNTNVWYELERKN